MIEQGFSIPGTVSSEFGKKELHSWRSGFYARLIAHAERAAATVADASTVTEMRAAAQGTTSSATSENGGGVAREEVAAAAVKVDIEDGHPKIVAFAGKRQVALPLMLEAFCRHHPDLLGWIFNACFDEHAANSYTRNLKRKR